MKFVRDLVHTGVANDVSRQVNDSNYFQTKLMTKDGRLHVSILQMTGLYVRHLFLSLKITTLPQKGVQSVHLRHPLSQDLTPAQGELSPTEEP